ncbi:MAG: hypothetical protein HFG89_05590 [Dorea sp.]|jgi:cobalamin biosynthesis protein CbiG|nr:hypothetical protein [Dorea sp.]
MKEEKAIAIFSFTRAGNRQNRLLLDKLSGCGYKCEGYTTPRLRGTEGLKALDEDMKTWVGRQWGKKSFLFIGAAGIAVRYIAPWVKDKYTDSAVLVMDEKGEYVIPLLSGHMGGAVEIAKKAAEVMHAAAVITTATDVRGKFAVDVFARENGLRITDRHLVTRISAAALEEEPIGFYSELPVGGSLPQGLIWCRTREELSGYACAIAVLKRISDIREGRSGNVLFLVPFRDRRIVVGVGCRRGTMKQEIETALKKILKEYGLRPEDVVKLASIDLKKEEVGIMELSREYQIPFYTYSPSELQEVKGEISASDFVREITGVDNVCERAARCCAPEGRLLQPKRIVDGITFALVEEQNVLVF